VISIKPKVPKGKQRMREKVTLTKLQKAMDKME
jgi:hypothetical protein